MPDKVGGKNKESKMKKMFVTLLIISAIGLSANAATFYAEALNDHFTPKHLYVSVGSTVSWTNYGTHVHTVTDSTGLFDSGDLTRGQSFSYTYNTVGDFIYYCRYHVAMGMWAVVHVRTQAQLTLLLSMTPIRPPIVIPAAGGNFSYQVMLTNQTSATIPTAYWTKMYRPDTTVVQTFLKSGIPIPGNGSRQAIVSQNVPGSAPAGLYRFQGNLGANPDSVLAWANFTFTKSLTDLVAGTEWESVMLTDWQDTPNPTAPVATAPTGVSVQAQNSKFNLSNSPEPFNPSTAINFTLPAAGVAQA